MKYRHQTIWSMFTQDKIGLSNPRCTTPEIRDEMSTWWSTDIRQFEACLRTTKSWQSTLVLQPWDSTWDEYMMKHSHQTIWSLFTYRTTSWQSTLVLQPWDSTWDEYMMKHSHQTIWSLFTYNKILAIYPCSTTLRFQMRWVHHEAQPSDNLKLVHIQQNLGNLPVFYNPEILDEMSTWDEMKHSHQTIWGPFAQDKFSVLNLCSITPEILNEQLIKQTSHQTSYSLFTIKYYWSHKHDRNRSRKINNELWFISLTK